MATKKPQVKAYIEQELREKFKTICDIEKRSESNMIEYLINKCVKEYESKNGNIKAEEKNINVHHNKGVIIGDNNGTMNL